MEVPMRLLLLVSTLLITGCNSGGSSDSGQEASESGSVINPGNGFGPEPDEGNSNSGGGSVAPGGASPDPTDLDPNVAPITTDDWYQPPVLTTWQWQISGTVNTSYNVDIYDIDLFDSSESLIQELQASGKKVICYFSAGSYEAWRPDANQYTESDLGNTLDGWPDERWLDIRSANVHSIMKQRLDLAKQKGCDGVEPDNIDGYTNNTGINLTSSDQLAYNRFLANEAHSRQLSIGLKNDLDQVSELVDYYDFAINEQCSEYNECDTLAPFINQGKAVLNAEYKQEYVNDATARNTLCNASLTMKFSTLILPLDLNDEFRFSCL